MDQKRSTKYKGFSSCISERRPNSDIIYNCAQRCPICSQVNASVSAMGTGSSKPTSSIPNGSSGPPVPAGRQVLEDYQTNFLEEQNKKRMAIQDLDSLKPPGQENSTPSPTTHENNPAETGYDSEARWTNIYNILTGRMTPLGQHYFREDKYIQNEARDCKNCDEWRDWCFKYSPTVIFLRKNIEALNGDLNEKNVRCRRCPTRRTEDGGFARQGGGFSPDHGILICANEMRDRKHLEDTLAHEMVHAWDHLRWKVDWADLRHAACTEIRASSLSGECRFMREFWTRNNWKLTQQHQNCVRTRAVKSVMARPACKDDVQAVKVVNEVWDSCFSDTRPFDEIYR